MSTLIFNPKYIFCAIMGTLWALIEPTLPFLGICVMAIAVDCFTAWRCNRRIYTKYRHQIKQNPKATIDGKLKSHHMSKMIGDMSTIFFCVILAYHADNTLLPHMGDLHLAQYVSAIFCVVQFISILENESTCNSSPWARVLQKIIADKTERHLGIKLKELMKEEENTTTNQ